MYGTSSLEEISGFSVSQVGQAFNAWDAVGTGWNDILWNSWHVFKNNSGGWMGSSRHRQNILTGFFTDLGVGLAIDVNDTPIPGVGGPFGVYWTQNFAAGDTAVIPLPPAYLLFFSTLSVLGLIKRKS